MANLDGINDGFRSTTLYIRGQGGNNDQRSRAGNMDRGSFGGFGDFNLSNAGFDAVSFNGLDTDIGGMARGVGSFMDRNKALCDYGPAALGALAPATGGVTGLAAMGLEAVCTVNDIAKSNNPAKAATRTAFSAMGLPGGLLADAVFSGVSEKAKKGETEEAKAEQERSLGEKIGDSLQSAVSEMAGAIGIGSAAAAESGGKAGTESNKPDTKDNKDSAGRDGGKPGGTEGKGTESRDSGNQRDGSTTNASNGSGATGSNTGRSSGSGSTGGSSTGGSQGNGGQGNGGKGGDSGGGAK